MRRSTHRWGACLAAVFLLFLNACLSPGVDPRGARNVNPDGNGRGGNGDGTTTTPEYVPPANANDYVDLAAPVPPLGDDRYESVRDERFGPVYFAYNQYAIGDAERGKLSTLASYLQENPREKLVIEGHCDIRGSEEYNRGLGERRAIAVKEYLVGLGLAADRLRTLSYGEERPADPGNTEEAHRRNRRAEFVILKPKD